jgi:autotransporter-associated beta strand protein
MALKDALCGLFDRFCHPRPGRSRLPARSARPRPPTLERLETRLTPAQHVWSGAVSTSWRDDGNWSMGGSPLGDASADLVYPASGATRFTSQDDLASGAPIHSIRFDGAGYELNATPANRVTLGTDVTAANTSGVNAIDVDISLAAGDHTMTVAGDGVLDIVRHVSGGAAGSNLVKDGVGELVFIGPDNGYLNNTQVQAGTLRIAGTDGSGDYMVSAMEVGPGATLEITAEVGGTSVGSLSGSGRVAFGEQSALSFGSDNTSTEFSGVISGPGYIYKLGTGTQTLSGLNRYTGITDIGQGSLRLGIDNALPSTTFVALVPVNGGTLDLANNRATIEDVVGGDGSTTVNLGTGTLAIHPSTHPSDYYNGVIRGDGGSLVMNGPNVMRLGGNNTYTGPTTINGGTLEIDGNQPQSPVTVAAGAVLSGTGTVGPATVLPGGTLQPGSVAAPTGTLSVAGDVTFAGTPEIPAIFAVELDGAGAGQHSQLNATGTVDLGTATTLNVTIGYASSSGDTFTGVITCANLVHRFSVVPPEIQDSYSTTDLDLSIL